MKQEKLCEPEDMVRFLLAICCQDDSSTTPVSRSNVLDTCFTKCLADVAKIAQSDKLKEKLDD